MQSKKDKLNSTRVAEVSELFTYDENSPSRLAWKVNRYSGKSYGALHKRTGEFAGTLRKEGYWVVYVNYKSVKIHNIIWYIHNGDIPENCVIDHIDGNSSNNNINNLRIVPLAQNARNAKKFATNKSGTSGVYKRVQIIRGREHSDWVACWQISPVKKKSKYFSISKYGEELARFLAEETRDIMIRRLNLKGAGYTERHGK